MYKKSPISRLYFTNDRKYLKQIAIIGKISKCNLI